MDYEKSLHKITFEMLCKAGGQNMFYGLFLAELNKSFCDHLPTACVGRHISSNNISLIIGKNWWEEVCFNDSRKTWTLIHELEHVVREHLSDFSAGMYPDKLVANIAMDMSINQEINEEMPDTKKDGKPTGIVDIKNFGELKLERNKSSLYYYTRLIEAKKKKEDSKGSQDSKAGPKGNKNGTSGCEELDKFLDSRDNGTYQDWHEMWNDVIKGMGEKEVEMTRKEMQEMIKRVAEETKKAQGVVPIHISDAVDANFGKKPPVISWKTLFNRFIGATLTTDIYQTRKRPNFRFEDAPSNKYKNKIRIVVGCDTSGSVSEDELKEFFGQINHMYKAGVQVDVCLWDAACDEPYRYKGEKTYKRTRGGGGTRASCFIEYVNKHKSKNGWTCAINLTDGFIERDPIACSIPMLWVITASGDTSFEHKSKKIRMN